MTITSKLPNASLSLRVLARLLSYPDAGLRRHVPEMRNALHADRDGALGVQRIAHLWYVAAQPGVGIAQQARKHAQAQRSVGKFRGDGHGSNLCLDGNGAL